MGKYFIKLAWDPELEYSEGKYEDYGIYFDEEYMYIKTNSGEPEKRKLSDYDIVHEGGSEYYILS